MAIFSNRPWIATVLSIALILPILIAGGFGVRSVVDSAFHAEIASQAAEVALNLSIRQQLDEETGVRGYALTRQSVFLDPYDRAAAALPGNLALLERDLHALGLAHADGAAREMVALNARWLHEVARPVIAGTVSGSEAVQKHGKVLVDRFRDRAQTIVDDLRILSELRADQTEAAISRVTLLSGIAIAMAIALAVLANFQRSTLQGRMDAERRRSAELAAAYNAEKRIADTLQEAFVTKTLPSVPKIELSATYVPASEESRVGGDWYETVELPGNKLLFAIGDVAGHGIDAAVSMNLTRQALLAAVAFSHDPATLLTRMNAELLNAQSRMVTAMVGVANIGDFSFTYASAAQPPALLIEPGKSARALALGGIPLAMLPAPVYETRTVQTVPGAMLVLYTDGAIEYDRDLERGEERLRQTATEVAALGYVDSARAIHDSIFNARLPADDVAILTIAFQGSLRPTDGNRPERNLRLIGSARPGLKGMGPVARVPNRTLERLAS
jgi:serine phosphatase RsbU (regulator of sigma subunit)